MCGALVKKASSISYSQTCPCVFIVLQATCCNRKPSLISAVAQIEHAICVHPPEPEKMSSKSFLPPALVKWQTSTTQMPYLSHNSRNGRTISRAPGLVGL